MKHDDRSSAPSAPCAPSAAECPLTPSTGDLAHQAHVVRRYFFEVWNQGDLALLDELLTADYRNHSPSTADPPPGPAGLAPIVAAMRAGFPDLHYHIEDLLSAPGAVAVRVTMTGTHEGPLFGLPPTGRRVRVAQMNVERFRDGRIAEHWRVTDELALMRQLGVVP